METPPQTPARRSAESFPPATCIPVAKKAKKSGPVGPKVDCICNWGDLCKEAYDTFQDSLPDDDPWKGKAFVNVLNKKAEPSLKMKAYRKAVFSLFKKT